jgi:ureidoglycolate lyase
VTSRPDSRPDSRPEKRPAVVPEALSALAFAPFGRVIEAVGTGHAANQGTATKFDRLGGFDNRRPGRATANVSVFRASARRDWPLEVALLEKHPHSTQIFVPMAAERYLVIVAPGVERPDLAALRAFVATGRQAIAYAPGTWHHPIVALEQETDFACLVHEDGGAEDCVEQPIANADRPRVAAPEVARSA